jgi:disulfide bond formation protein DsbB
VRVYQFRHTGLRALYIFGARARPSEGLASALRIGQVQSRIVGDFGGAAGLRTKTIMKRRWIDGIFSEPAGVAALAVFALSAATLGGAWFFQYVLKLPPCPLCLEERIPYHIVIPLSLLMAIAAYSRAPAKLLTVGFVAIGIAVLCNAVLGAYHAGVEWHWWAGPTDCTGPLTDLKTTGALLDQLQTIHVVRCDEAAWRFLGISLAGYNVLISLALAAIAGCGLLARKPA